MGQLRFRARVEFFWLCKCLKSLLQGKKQALQMNDSSRV
jgi:hypothetical protein